MQFRGFPPYSASTKPLLHEARDRRPCLWQSDEAAQFHLTIVSMPKGPEYLKFGGVAQASGFGTPYWDGLDTWCWRRGTWTQMQSA